MRPIQTAILVSLLVAGCSPSNPESSSNPERDRYEDKQAAASSNAQLGVPAAVAPAEPVVKFGLSEEQRRKVYFQVLKIEHDACNKAAATYPLVTAGALAPGGRRYSQAQAEQRYKQNAAYSDNLYKQYRSGLMRQWRLGEQQLLEIQGEGMENRWMTPQDVIDRNRAAGQQRERAISQLFADDGSLPMLAASVKLSMHDPSSFEHVKTVYSDKGGYLVVRMAYRGCNGFGAMVLESATAKVSLSGEVLSVQADE